MIYAPGQEVNKPYCLSISSPVTSRCRPDSTCSQTSNNTDQLTEVYEVHTHLVDRAVPASSTTPRPSAIALHCYLLACASNAEAPVDSRCLGRVGISFLIVRLSMDDTVIRFVSLRNGDAR